MIRSRAAIYSQTYLTTKVVLALVTILAVSPAHSEQESIPDTPAGRVLAAWLEAFNSGDQARIGAYQQQYEPTSGLPLDAMMSFRARTGGFDIVAIKKTEPLYIEFLVKERASDTRGIGRFDVTSSSPPKVATSGLRAIPPGAAIIGFQIDEATRDRVIAGSIAKLNESYVFPEAAQKMEQMLRRHQKRGDYDGVKDGEKFASLLTTHLQEVSRDKHLRVNFSAARFPDELSSPSPQHVAENRRLTERANCGFEKVELLAGNVGYVKFNMFADPAQCGQTAIAAMNFLANVDAIIFDLRDNGGGDPAMIALISTYLFEQPTHLNDIWNRKTGATQQYWTLPVVPGKRLAAAPAFVLTSFRTFSGAEEFSYNLQNHKRATIVGEKTGGGAHPVRGERIDDRFVIGVPFARAINPITKTNWEGTGVEPDVKVPAADALATAQKLAAEKLVPESSAPRAAAN
ncbi:S41 family peptidase [Steroidobacter cummioxidans]|uniref:S41 family peptidase n=1 Tax=Steroidobacter cummioxidans TaxID=1803913 RepID=UPI00137AAA82|nr:S41 family peptidase [Steroidobacter cummioxidans]